jgi:hypothetical protein
VPFAPSKTNPPLVINAHAVLAFSITFQALQAVSRHRRERSEIRRRVEHVQLPKGLALDGLEPAHGFPAEQAFGVSAPKGPDHF